MYYTRKALTRRAKTLAGFPPVLRRYDAMYRDIERRKPRNILEIGTHDGRNAITMVNLARSEGTTPIYFGFDLFESLTRRAFYREFSLRAPSLRQVNNHLKRNGITDFHLFPGPTEATLPEASSALPPIDFAYIDGGHSYETVRADWEALQPLLHKDSIVFFDDYPNFGVPRLISEIDRSKWAVDILPTTDRYRILRRSFRPTPEQTHLQVQHVRVRATT